VPQYQQLYVLHLQAAAATNQRTQQSPKSEVEQGENHVADPPSPRLTGAVTPILAPFTALYFVDAEGIIRDQHFGEGRYEESERGIQRLLGVERELVSVEGFGVEAEADWDNLRTPETYLGYERSEHFASSDGAFDERRAYELPERLRFNHWALGGEWTIGREQVVLDQAGGSIAFRFHARDAHLVLSPGAGGPIPYRVLLDGEAPGPSRGVDVDEDGTGVLRDGRLYQLVRAHDPVRERTLEITFQEPGAEAYVFTFG
jgi:thioredoxin family protein